MKLVRTFYAAATKDELLGPVFAKVDLEAHFPIMDEFWSIVLLNEGNYTRNAFDRHVGLGIDAQHFERWLKIFNATVDRLFSGEKAELAKQRAASIAWIFRSKLGLKETKRLHWIQHVPFEGLGLIESWAKQNDYVLTCTRVHANEKFPDTNDFDVLVVLGGPMGAYEDDLYPWMREEKALIKKAIDEKKTVIGICLGAQLIAAVLGARVYRNAHKEIGWMPVWLTDAAKNHPLGAALEKQFITFHWHGDTFDLPQGATHLWQSEGCAQQGFLYHDHVLAMQFHPEVNAEAVKKMYDHEKEDATPGPFVQEEMIAVTENGNASNLSVLLNWLVLKK